MAATLKTYAIENKGTINSETLSLLIAKYRKRINFYF